MAHGQRDTGAPSLSGTGGTGPLKVCLKCRARYRTGRDTCPKDGSTLLDFDLPQGTVLAGKYRILERLGRGGMGVVYRAEHVIMGKPVAIKVINPLLSTEPRFLEMFKTEARMAATFKHRYALTVHDFGESEGRFYLVMELLEGRSLKKVLDEQTVFPPERAFGILLKICEAVSAAHSAGIVHLDLKGENIFINEADEGVKVLDFGLAQLADTAPSGSEEFSVGTVGYMAPEQIVGGHVGKRTDVYALGVLAYEMLTGDLPFPGKSKEEILDSQMAGKRRKFPKSRVLKVVPKETKAVIIRAIAADPQDRPKSVDELAASFRAALDAVAVAARRYARGTSGEEKRDGLFSRLAGRLRSAFAGEKRASNGPPGMALVPAGPFLMGSNLSGPDERPASEIPLEAFYIDIRPVTNLDYVKFVQATDHRPPKTWKTLSFPPGTAELPVTGVTWQDAVDYCVWSGKRLPTEAEWEKAARGTVGRVYPWGNKWEPAHANWGGNPKFFGKATVRPVGSFPHDRSRYGCLDMAGNVKQWTASWYKPYGPTDNKNDDFGEKYRVIRGGSYMAFDKKYLRCSQRSHARPDETGDIGFRCVMDVDVWAARRDEA